MVDIQSEEYRLGRNIRKYRLSKHWTQNDLSNAVNIDRADISKYENGTKGEMGFKTLKKFAQALEVTIDQLMRDEDERPKIIDTYNQLNDNNKAIMDQMMDALLQQQRQSA